MRSASAAHVSSSIPTRVQTSSLTHLESLGWSCYVHPWTIDMMEQGFSNRKALWWFMADQIQ
jgi:hypothetical protein